jgi:hypothetical protein
MKKFICLLISLCLNIFATDRYLSTTGANTGSGSIGAPWLTFDYAAANSSAGDTIYINDGIYSERWTMGSTQGGSAGNSKKYIALNSLMVTNSGGFTVSQGAGYSEFSGIKFLDSSANPDWEGIVHLYHSTSGVALGAGFGFTNCWFQGTQDPTTHNIIGLGMDNATSYAKYALNFTLKSCVFTNTSQYSLSLCAKDSIVQDTRFDFANTHDAMHIWFNNVIISNCVFTNISRNVNISDHTDLIQYWWGTAQSPCTNLYITKNLFINSEAQFFQIEGDDTSSSNFGPVGGMFVYNNIFVNVQHHGSIDVPNVHFWNNLFYNCIMSDGSGDMIYMAGAGNPKGEAKNSSFKNNAFIGCGSSSSSTTTGWYDASELGVPENFVADYNFVCTSTFGAKNNTDFRANGFEVHGVNGGNPKFELEGLNIFRLRSGSILIDAGITITNFGIDFESNARPLGSSWDIGPYEYDSHLIIKYNPLADFSGGVFTNLAGGNQHGLQYQSTNWPYSTNFQNRAGSVFTVRTGNAEGATEVGYGDYIAITDLTSLQTLTNGTISFWAVYSTITNWDTQLRVERILDAGYQGMPWSAGTFFIGRGFSDVSGDSYQTVMRRYGTDGLANPTTLLTWPDHVSSTDGTTTNFLFYTMTWDGTASGNNLKAYLNGSLVSSNSMGVPYFKMTNDFNWVGIGCWTHDGTPSMTDGDGYPNNGWFSGILGEVRIYDRTLSAAEVYSLYLDNGASLTASSSSGSVGFIIKGYLRAPAYLRVKN